ncbi:MAG: LysE family transporter [Rhodospirillaceae bacterium]|nr:LysE family transporter [Rhodospirillaceae bacterium]
MNFEILQVAFIRGLVAGFALAAPMGPVAMLCVRRTLAKGRVQALIAGTGAAVADMIFGAVAGLGITVVNTFVTDYQSVIGAIGGVIVLAMGILTYRSPIVMSDGEIKVQSLRRDTAAAFTMAITNPATMGAAAGLFAAFGVIDAALDPSRAFWLVAGVFAGSMLWWVILVGAVGFIREGFLRRGLTRLNQVFGAIIALSGIAVLVAVAVRILA